MTSEFAIALHILGSLTSRGGGPLTSDQMADTYDTHAVVIRRVQSKLNKAGLIRTRRGAGGGSVLAREPADISLREAYEAVAPEPRLLPQNPDSCKEAVPVVMGEYVSEICAEAEQALLARLETITIKQMDRTIRTRIRKAMTVSQGARGRGSAP
ncbi:MAG: Rrf2 family transcriptional regulator [Planctomycetota bacterium]